MTSSLVGSEMCIRDRSLRARRVPMCARDKANRSTRGSPTSSGNPEAPNPVSYTHLTLPTICSV
eukprot:9475521-Prorocentrum_lima.AAC.1